MAKGKKIKGQGEFDDTKEIITSLKSKKNREHNGQDKYDKWKNNDLQITTQKTKDEFCNFVITLIFYIFIP
jgi:hypothetical protein